MPTPKSLAPGAPTIPVPSLLGTSIRAIDGGLQFRGAYGLEAAINGIDLYEDGHLVHSGISAELARFLDLSAHGPMKVKFDPPGIDASWVDATTDWTVVAQFPPAGTLVPPGAEIVLQFHRTTQ